MATLDLIDTLVVVRDKIGFVDDPDYALTQDIAGFIAAQIGVEMSRFQSKQAVAFQVIFLDGLGAPVVTGRGAYDATPMLLRTLDATTQYIFDGCTATGRVGARRYILPDTQVADFVGLRFTNIVPPAGAVSMRLLGEPLAL